MTASPDPTDLSAMLAGLFASGRAADIVLGVLLAEGAVLMALALRRGASCLPVLANVAAGAFLVLALRGALLHEPWPVVALPLLLSFAAHGAELAFRSRGATLRAHGQA